MAQDLKWIVQEMCRRTGLPIPPSVIGSTVPQVGTLLGLMNEFLDDIYTRKAWQQVLREATFVSIANEDQGVLTTIISDTGFEDFVPDTFFNRTTNLKVSTGLDPARWQANKAASGNAGPFYEVRLRQGHLLISPTPPVGETFAFEYRSSAFILDADDATYKSIWGKDTDLLQLPVRVAVAWLRMAYKREKGLEYAEDAMRYETLVATISSRDNSPRDIHMEGRRGQSSSGVIVPVGTWSL